MIALTMLLLLPGADWSGLGDTDGDRIAPEANPPLRWSATENIAFSTALPGRGDSSPAVAGDWVHVTTQEGADDLVVLTINRANGRVHKKTRVGQGTLAANGPRSLWADRHNAASPSPVASHTHVWAFFGTGLLVCLEAETHRGVWRRDLVKDYGAYDITFGMGASPRLMMRDGKPVLLVNAITKGASYVLCLDAMTGAEIWKTDRRYAVFRDAADAYAAPVVRQGGKGLEVVVVGADRVDAYGLDDGQRRWVVDGLDIDSPYARIIATPAIGTGRLDGLIVACTANPGGGGNGRTHAYAINDERGSGLPLWSYRKGSPDSCSPLLAGGTLMLLSGQGTFTTLDPAKGTRRSVERLPGEYFASPVAATGGPGGTVTVYCLATDGRCSVLTVDPAKLPFPQPELVDVSSLPGTFYASPAITEDTLWLRSWDRLYAIRK